MRGIGILLVVLGHCDSPFTRFIYGFHMPLFFLLSGLLLSKRKQRLGFRAFVKNCCIVYFKPYILLCGINLILQSVVLIIKHELSVEKVLKYVIGILYSRGSTEWMPNCSPLWFLTCLFVAMFLWYWIGKTEGIITVLAVLLCTIFSLLFDSANVVKMPWNFDTALMAVAFIYVGQQLSRMKHSSDKRLYIFLTPVFFIIGCLGITYNSVDMVSFDNNHYGNLIFMFFGAFGICIALLQLCYLCEDRWNNIAGRFIAYLGRHTIFIMGFDYFSGSVAGILFEKMESMRGYWMIAFIAKMSILLTGLCAWNFIADRLPCGLKGIFNFDRLNR